MTGNAYVQHYINKNQSFEIKPTVEWLFEVAEYLTTSEFEGEEELNLEQQIHCFQIAFGFLRLMHKRKAITVIPYHGCSIEKAKQFYDYFDGDTIIDIPASEDDEELFRLIVSGTCARRLRSIEELEEMSKPTSAFANETEEKFKEWLDHHGYHWIYADQSVSSFAKVFRDMNIKRPDFFIRTKLGEIAVDVKSRRLYKKWNSVQLDSADDIEKYQNYEIAFRQPVWFAFHLEGSDYSEFYWVSLRDVLTKTTERTSSNSGEVFRPIPLSICTKINWVDSISKLLE